MSKVQTFDEWFAGQDLENCIRDLMRDVWKAAHENAAMVCEKRGAMWEGDRTESAGHMSFGAECCADAIREAAK